MKLFDVDWNAVLHDLQRWDALPLPARRILLDELRPSGYVPVERFGAYAEAIVASGIAQYDAQKRRMSLTDERRQLVKVLRAMGRHPLFHLATADGANEPARNDVGERTLHASLVRYMEEHFTGVEIEGIASHALGKRGGYANKYSVAAYVETPGWVGNLLDARDDAALLAWATERGQNPVDFFSDAILVLLDLQVLVRNLLEFPDGVSIRDLLATTRNDDELETLADALRIGLGTLVIFAGMRAEDLEPTIGLWPTVVRELTRVPTQPPAAVEVTEEFSLAVYMEDMTTLLAAVTAAPVRVRANDAAVFARARAEIEKRLVALPPWVAQILGTERVDHAARELELRGLVSMRDVQGNPHLHPTAAGARWLVLSPHDRLAALVEPMRKSKEANPRNAYDPGGSSTFFPYTLPYYRAPKSVNLRADLTRALLRAKDSFIAIDDFLDYAARSDNPLLALAETSGGRQDPMFYDGYSDPRGAARDMWRQMLQHFLSSRLIGLGGASIGLHTSGAICFRLTGVGHYLLGEATSFDYGSDVVADVVVQPNFDVVFLGAAPAIEAEIARFSERVGVAPGRVFRITRASVLAAAESGASAGDVIGALTRASTKPVPKNVQHEIAGWMGAIRRATMRRAELLECADADVAARIVALLGAGVRQLAPTVFELSGITPASRATMTKKLRVGGVFVDAHAIHATASSRRRIPDDEE